MNGLFAPDSRFMRYLNRLADLMILNLLFLLTSIPIFTIGASLTALYSVCFRLGTDREGSTFRDYFAAFKENFRQATSLFLLLLLWLMGTGGAAVISCFMAGWMHCLFVPLQSCLSWWCWWPAMSSHCSAALRTGRPPR